MERADEYIKDISKILHDDTNMDTQTIDTIIAFLDPDKGLLALASYNVTVTSIQSENRKLTNYRKLRMRVAR